MNIRVIDTGPRDGFYNMALDEALLLICRDTPWRVPTLRFYTFSPPAITIGRFQKIEDVELCKISSISLGGSVGGFQRSRKPPTIDIVRRITGGRAILHDGDLTYSLVFDAANPVFGGSPFYGYKKMSRIFKDALHLLGVKAHLVRVKHSKYQKNPGCFSSIARYELQVNGKKILGSAQRREGGVILQQGSLILNQKLKIKNQKWGQVGLTQIMGRKFEVEEVILAVKEALKNMDINITDETLTTKEKKLANELIPKYVIGKFF